jgi:hypothetical protein
MVVETLDLKDFIYFFLDKDSNDYKNCNRVHIEAVEENMNSISIQNITIL